MLLLPALLKEVSGQVTMQFMKNISKIQASDQVSALIGWLLISAQVLNKLFFNVLTI